MDGLVEKVAAAMESAVICDDEGEFPRLFDLLGFSGENKSRTVTRGLARAAIEAMFDAIAEPSEGAIDAGSAVDGTITAAEVWKVMLAALRKEALG